MALVLPRTRPNGGGDNGGVSNAELDVLAELEKLPGDWIVLHSLWLKSHAFKVHAEADFVVLSDRAALIIEVKGGKVWRDAEGWHFRTNSGSRENIKREGPLDQARGAYYAILDHLEKHGRRNLFEDHVWGYGAILPESGFRVDSRDTAIDTSLVLDITGFPSGVAQFIERLATYWHERLISGTHHVRRKGGPLLPISASRRQEIVEFLRPEMEKIVGVGIEVASSEQQLIRLTDRQLSALDQASLEARNIFIGSAGTGKTVLAVEQARRMCEAGKRVLFVCFNSLLAARVQMDLKRKGFAQVAALNYHQLASQLLRKAGMTVPFSEDWEQFETALEQILVDIVADFSESEKYDYLVIDEAQDLMSRPFMVLLDCLVTGGLKDGRWLIAIDTQQAIFRKHYEPTEYERLVGYGKKTLLELNCRNTRPIAAYVRAVSGIGSVSTRSATGEMPVVRYYDDRSAYLRLLKKVVNDLITGFITAGLPPSEIVVLASDLSFLPPEALEAGFFLRAARKVQPDNADGNFIQYSSIQGFKGLEARAVVVVGIERFDDDISRDLFYVGASRARGALRILLPATCEHMQRAAPEIAELLQAGLALGS